ncbi:hypothetical protein HK28_12870 [Acetobacter sp. DsW_063]|nr:hypothetical protein HK28_12870 [Acetobacter sp. DsW_063]
MAQRAEDTFLEAVAADVLPVVAGAFVARCRAPHQIGRDHGVAATTATAARQPGEQMLRPAAIAEMILFDVSVCGLAEFQCALPRLGSLPQIIIENTQFRDVVGDPFGIRVYAGLTLACIRILDEALAIPHQPADIQLVVEDPDATLAVAVDGGKSPGGAAGGRNAVIVQFHRDALGRFARDIIPEDAPDDVGLGLVDRAVASDPLAVAVEFLDHIVAV